MQLVDTLVEDFVRLLAGKVQHLGAESAGIFSLVNEALSAKVDHDAAG